MPQRGTNCSAKGEKYFQYNNKVDLYNLCEYDSEGEREREFE